MSAWYRGTKNPACSAGFKFRFEFPLSDEVWLLPLGPATYYTLKAVVHYGRGMTIHTDTVFIPFMRSTWADVIWRQNFHTADRKTINDDIG